MAMKWFKWVFAAWGVIVWTAAGAGAGPATIDAVKQALANSDLDAAIKLADQVVAAEPKAASGYTLRAVVYDARKDYERAVADYGRAIELSPGAADAYQRRGEDHFRLGH